MKILNILKSEADKNTTFFIDTQKENHQSDTVALYNKEINWDQLVDDIFNSDQVICWW